ENITRFAAYVGGSPTNIIVGATRLGLRTALLTAVGNDPVGRFILNFLDKEGVGTSFIPVKPGHNSSAVLLGIEQDAFPIQFYRDNCADKFLDVDDVRRVPWNEVRALEVSGTALAAEPCRSATLHAVELAKRAGCQIYLDLDFRANQWFDVRAYGITLRPLLRDCHVVIGTEEEINACLLSESSQVTVENAQVTAPTVHGSLEDSIRAMLHDLGVQTLVVKTGERGCSIHTLEGRTDVPGFRVTVQNVLGAGDAFAAGLIYGRLTGKDWFESARIGNACGAIVVTEHGCANFTPRLEAVQALMESQPLAAPIPT
ncbi:MAG TPA: 5-dehydro-2-deoxygluconokinase, partial [Deinococcales bacterium]|nr:5-dehydro-2-deoxygluconokinase [Deinococcales bacterium]